MGIDTSLPLSFSYPLLQIMLLIVLHVHSRNEDRRIREKVIHLLQRTFGGFRLDSPEEESVCEVADDLQLISPHWHSKRQSTYENIIELVANIFQRDWCHLTDHGIEGEACHCCD